MIGQYKFCNDFDKDDWWMGNLCFLEENFVKNFDLVEKIEVMVKVKGVILGQFMLVWFMK